MAVGTVLILSLLASASVRADDQHPARLWALHFEPGALFAADHLQRTGASGTAPPLYAATTIERVIVGPLRAGVNGGLSVPLGWLVGGTIRYMAFSDKGPNISFGVGPLYAPRAVFGAATFMQADATAQLPIVGTFYLVAGGSLGLALSHAGARKCGVDSCEAYLVRGDTVGSLRLGVGVAL